MNVSMCNACKLFNKDLNYCVFSVYIGDICPNFAPSWEDKWLTELKGLRNSVGAVKLSNMKEALELIRAYKAENIAQKKLIAEYKRLLKAAVEDLAKIPCNNDVYIPSSCNACIKQGNCDYSDSFKWRYADEVEKFLKF